MRTRPSTGGIVERKTSPVDVLMETVIDSVPPWVHERSLAMLESG